MSKTSLLLAMMLFVSNFTFGASFLDSITPVDDTLSSGDYAMWWPDKEDPVLQTSESIKLISKIYEESDGYESVILAPLLAKLGYVPASSRRIKYSKDPIYDTARYADGSILVISVDQEHGIRIRFPVSTTSPAKRVAILKDYLNWVQKVKSSYPNLDQDPPWDPRALGWWKTALQGSIKLESEGYRVKIGFLPAEG